MLSLDPSSAYYLNGNNTLHLQHDNTTSNDTILDLQLQLYLALIVPGLFGVIAVVGFVGNVMVIIAVLLNRQMRSTTNLLIIHLALADLLFIVFCVPFTAVSYVITVWPFGDAWCKIYQYMNQVTAITSVYTLVLLSLDRYLAVCHPIKSIDIRSPKNTLLAIWLVTGIISLSLCPSLAYFAIFQFNQDISRCVNVRIIEDPSYYKTFQLCFFAFGFAIPLGLVCLLYGLMIRRLRYGGGKNRRVAGKANQKNKKRITRLVMAVVTTFALCWLPIHIIFLVQSRIEEEDDEDDEPVFPQVAAQCLAYLNSCVNPILYAFLSEQFRRSFLQLFSGCRSSPPLSIRIKTSKPTAVVAATAMVAATSVANKQLLQQVPVEGIEVKLVSNEAVGDGKCDVEEGEKNAVNLSLNRCLKVSENQERSIRVLNNNNTDSVSIIAC